jgi:hypothetical protein
MDGSVNPDVSVNLDIYRRRKKEIDFSWDRTKENYLTWMFRTYFSFNGIFGLDQTSDLQWETVFFKDPRFSDPSELCFDLGIPIPPLLMIFAAITLSGDFEHDSITPKKIDHFKALTKNFTFKRCYNIHFSAISNMGFNPFPVNFGILLRDEYIYEMCNGFSLEESSWDDFFLFNCLCVY